MRSLELLDRHVQATGGEPRQGQRSLAVEITNAIAESRPLVAEAPTGSGKSWASLIPAIESGAKTLVVTATKALQDQLINRDLPGLRDGLFPGLTFQAVKGRSNYLCLLRWDELTNGVQLKLDADTKRAMQLPVADESLLSRWIEETDTGDRGEVPGRLEPTTWPRVSVSPDDCAGDKCPYYEACFAEKAKAQAAAADVVIANMHLLVADQLTHGNILPHRDVQILDEVHHLPAVAAEMMGSQVSVERIRNAAVQARPYASDIGLENIDTVVRLLQDFGRALEGAGERRIPGGASGNEQLALIIPQLTGHLMSVNAGLKLPAGGDEKTKAERVKSAITSLLSDLSKLFEEDANYVTFVERVGNRHILRQCTIDVAPALRDGLWPMAATSILMSATVPQGIIQRVGLDDDTRNVRVDSPFDYENNAVLYVARHDRIDPRDDGREHVTAQHAGRLIEAAGGRTLWLFTSFTNLKLARDLLPKYTDATIFAQGDAGKNQLIEDFRSTDKAVLLGNQSFWTGVDIPGPDLQLVIIDKIPFPVPTNPLIEARNELAENDFREVALPDAAMLLTQGVGRLIRSTSDRGVVAVFDPRVAEAGYRHKLMAGFPPFRKTRDLDAACTYLEYLNAEVSAPPAPKVERQRIPPATKATYRPVHQLLTRENGFATAACGYSYELTSSGVPSEFTGWQSDVTCLDCRAAAIARTSRVRTKETTP